MLHVSVKNVFLSGTDVIIVSFRLQPCDDQGLRSELGDPRALREAPRLRRERRGNSDFIVFHFAPAPLAVMMCSVKWEPLHILSSMQTKTHTCVHSVIRCVCVLAHWSEDSPCSGEWSQCHRLHRREVGRERGRHD